MLAIPFGLPFKVMLDPDPTFRGDVQAQVEHLGIICDFCPAEAHWIIGMIERRNAVLRCVLEKLIDQFAVYEVLPAALHSCSQLIHLHQRQNSLSGCFRTNSTATRRCLH